MPIESPKKIRPDPVDFVKKCTCCGTVYERPTEFFMAASSPLYRNNSGRTTVCRGCVNKMYDVYAEKYGEEEAIRRICMRFDLYYCADLVKASKDMNENWSRMASYVKKSNLIAYHGKTYDDTLDEEASRSVRILQEEESEDANSQSAVTQEMVSKWGFGFSEDEYLLLEREFADWQNKCVIDGFSKETLVR